MSDLDVFQQPIPNAKTKKNFGEARLDSTGKPYNHSGLDIPARTGTPVHSVQIGQVWRAMKTKGYGETIVIKHSQNTYSLYAHLSKILVSLNEPVSPGDIIGLSGNSGERSTGPHLHFEIIELKPGQRILQQDERFGIATDISNRIDPTYLYSPQWEQAQHIDVAAVRSRIVRNSIILTLPLWGLLTWIFDPLAGWLSLSQIAVGATVAAAFASVTAWCATWIVANGKFRSHRNEVMRKWNFVISESDVQNALDRAEKTGARSANQQRKIDADIRAAVAAAASAANQASADAARLQSQLSDLSRSVADAQYAVEQAKREIDQRKLEEASRKLDELVREKKEISEKLDSAIEAADRANGKVADASARAEGAVKKAQTSLNVRDVERHGRLDDDDTDFSDHDEPLDPVVDSDDEEMEIHMRRNEPRPKPRRPQDGWIYTTKP